MRTLTGVSRLFMLVAISVAALLVVGGAYFIGYVGELQRELSGPGAASEQAQLTLIERSLGYGGFLKSYRAYWLGDASAHAGLLKSADDATRAVKELARLKVEAREVGAIVDAFANAAAAAPATPPSGLRGVSEEGVKTLPPVAQLETSYLALTSAIARLRDAERASTVQTLGVALDRSQIIIFVAVGALVVGLIVVAWLVRTRVIYPMEALERSLATAAQGTLGPPIWGTERRDEVGHLARAGETLRRCLAETPSLESLTESGRLRVTLDGPGSALFDRLAADASAAVETLQIAAGKASATQRIELNIAISQLGQACNEVRAAATTLRGDFGQIIESVRASSQTLLSVAAEGAHKVDEVAGRFATGSDELGAIAARANERIGAMLAELNATAQGLRQASEASSAAPVSEEMRSAITADFKAIADAVNGAADKVRDEVTRLIEHLGEERILPLRDGVVPIALLEAPKVGAPPKTLADVPKDEVMQRMGDLAAAMRTASGSGQRAEEIKASLSELADEMRQLGGAPATRRTSDELSVTLSRHADLIEANVAAPLDETLHDALDAMARELRQVTARARNSLSGEAAITVANSAAELEQRSQDLFAQLESAMGAAEVGVTFEATSADVDALSNLVAQLETRAEQLSEQAVARRFEEIAKAGSPAELREKAFADDLRTDHAIQVVFEAIERLNNVAASLARAGDAERQRRLVG